MWYILPNYKGKPPTFGHLDVACVLVLEDQYSPIVAIIAKEGKIQFGVTEGQFCNP